MAEPKRALIPLPQADEVDDDVWRILQAATRRNYQDPNIMRVLAHEPTLMQHLLAYSKYLLYDGDLEHRLLELVRLRLAQANACHY